jgi:hypothetical protein
MLASPLWYPSIYRRTLSAPALLPLYPLYLSRYVESVEVWRYPRDVQPPRRRRRHRAVGLGEIEGIEGIEGMYARTVVWLASGWNSSPYLVRILLVSLRLGGVGLAESYTASGGRRFAALWSYSSESAK